eukprot:188709-Pelagomonas_calceolata.AAC.1
MSWLRPFSLVTLVSSRGYKGVGLQPETMADQLLERVDIRTSYNVKACQERNRIYVWAKVCNGFTRFTRIRPSVKNCDC